MASARIAGGPSSTLNLPLKIMELPPDASMEDYDRILKETVGDLKSEGGSSDRFW